MLAKFLHKMEKPAQIWLNFSLELLCSKSGHQERNFISPRDVRTFYFLKSGDKSGETFANCTGFADPGHQERNFISPRDVRTFYFSGPKTPLKWASFVVFRGFKVTKTPGRFSPLFGGG